MSRRSSGTELTISGRLLLLLAWLATGAAWMTANEPARLVAALLWAPLLVDLLWKGWRLPALRVHAQPRRTQAGAWFVESMLLDNPLAARRLRDLVVYEPRTRAKYGAAFVRELRPGAPVRIELRGRARGRGRWRQRVLRIETLFPFGFVHQWRELPVDAELIVEPARLDAPALPPAEIQAGLAERAAGLLGAEFHSLREYAGGEDARLVHALRSAATGQLQRRVLQGDDPEEQLVVLDLRLPPAGRPPRRRFEWSLSVAATLIDQFAVRQRAGRFVILGERLESWSTRAADELLARLAELQPVAWRALGAGELLELKGARQIAWLAAGGFRAADDRQAIGGAPLLEPAA